MAVRLFKSLGLSLIESALFYSQLRRSDELCCFRKSKQLKNIFCSFINVKNAFY